MVVEPWIIKMGSHVSTNLKPSKKTKSPEKTKEKIGILSFEVATVMSKTIHLHKSLSDREITKLRHEIFNSDGICALISPDESYLLQLALAEKLDELNKVVSVVSRLGKKCSIPALRGFEHVYFDITKGSIGLKGSGFLVKDMEGMVRKMERYVVSTSALYGEMEVLRELEMTERKFRDSQWCHEESRRAFGQKLTWQRQDVGHLKEVSIWNRSYDKVVEMLARSVCTIYTRICVIFRDSLLGAELGCVGGFGGKSGQVELQYSNILMGSGPIERIVKDTSPYREKGDHRVIPRNGCNFSGPIEKILKEKEIHTSPYEERSDQICSNRVIPRNGCNFSGPIERAVREKEIRMSPYIGSNRVELPTFNSKGFNLACAMGPGRIFMECLSLSSSGSKIDDDEGFSYEDKISQISGYSSSIKREVTSYSSCSTRARSVHFGFDQIDSKRTVLNNSQFGSKSRLALHAPPSTVGGSALALHYANIIIVIEKLLRYPHLIGEEARDDLYQMLPASLRVGLKNSLKSYIKDLAIFDAPLAHDWKERLDGILKWLSPLAHNMIRWQSERNFEQQQIVTRINVLLLQTIYFADREKTEAAICELLVGLNYICRYEQQQNALLDCASSFDFEDFMDWRTQY